MRPATTMRIALRASTVTRQRPGPLRRSARSIAMMMQYALKTISVRLRTIAGISRKRSKSRVPSVAWRCIHRTLVRSLDGGRRSKIEEPILKSIHRMASTAWMDSRSRIRMAKPNAPKLTSSNSMDS